MSRQRVIAPSLQPRNGLTTTVAPVVAQAVPVVDIVPTEPRPTPPQPPIIASRQRQKPSRRITSIEVPQTLNFLLLQFAEAQKMVMPASRRITKQVLVERALRALPIDRNELQKFVDAHGADNNDEPRVQHHLPLTDSANDALRLASMSLLESTRERTPDRKIITAALAHHFATSAIHGNTRYPE